MLELFGKPALLLARKRGTTAVGALTHLAVCYGYVIPYFLTVYLSHIFPLSQLRNLQIVTTESPTLTANGQKLLSNV